MKTANLSEVTQDEFDESVQKVIAGIKAGDKRLDTRVGTVLRSLLVNPEARIEATVTKQLEYARKATSLKTLNEAKESGEDIDTEDVNAILANFNITSGTGTYANGLVKITVEDGSQVYTVARETAFTTLDGLEFTATETISAKAADSTLANESNAELYKGAAGYFFLVPVQAVAVGSSYNITQGTSLTVATSIYTLINAEAYTAFDGGSDIDDLGKTIERIPEGLAIRGFVNKAACAGMLQAAFGEGSNPIVACSSVGYGDSAQRRDKHNVFGVGVGGRIDLYVRNFGDLYTITKTVKGYRIPQGASSNSQQVDYALEITPGLFPGSCWVKSVSSIYDVNSSLDFACTRVSVGADGTWHDFNVKDDSSETFNTLWQGFHVTALEVPPDGGASTSSEADDTWSDVRDFKVCVYCLPQAIELQNYVDREDVRSLSTDVVVRCPIICNVTVSASIVYDPDKPVDVAEAKTRIRKYINGQGFVKALTRSEIVHILKACGAVSVDLSNKDMLYGVLHDAYGTEHVLSGDALYLDGLAEDGAMLSSKTAIFAAEPENIQIFTTPYK